MSNEELVQFLIRAGYIKTPEIAGAFRAVDRAGFVLEKLRDSAYFDQALPIGCNATISQPAVVAFMLEMLRPKRGEKILDIGSGSGWTAALFAHLVGEEGRVYSMEIVPELGERAEKTIKANYPALAKRITILRKSGKRGLLKEAPFHCIHAAAALSEIPEVWKEQLAIGGRMVLPVGSDLILVEHMSETRYNERIFHGFVFVPFQYG